LRGRATWYGAELHGNATASGEPFDMYGLTAAHRTLPLGSRARVTNLANGREVVVRINDRGPGRDGVMIDLSYAAAQAIGLQGSGPVEVEPLR
jgi:rare lipoprotein A